LTMNNNVGNLSPLTVAYPIHKSGFNKLSVGTRYINPYYIHIYV
jgi:hypothetical protein